MNKGAPKLTDIVFHKHAIGRKFKIINTISISQIEIEDIITGEKFIEPIEYILNIVDVRNKLIEFIIDEK